MNYRYNEYLIRELLRVQKDMGLSQYEIIVEEEQIFAQHEMKENSIYVVIKYLSDSKQTGISIQPVQFIILTEQNGLDITKSIFNKFATDYNWQVVIEGNEFIKQQYSNPVVLSNFSEVGYGYRSVLYMSATLTILENVVDLNELYIDDKKLEVLGFGMTYNMSTNTQQKASDPIATSVKNASSFAVSMTIPSQNNDLVTKCFNIISGNSNGNEDFKFLIKFKSMPDISRFMKLTSFDLSTAPNDVPGIRLGFMR